MVCTKRLGITLCSFLIAAILFGFWGFSILPVSGDYTPDLPFPSEDYSFVYSTGDELSYLMLWHNIDGHIDSANEADVLVVGNSRTQLGLLSSVLAPQMASLGLKIFWLSTGNGEGYWFSEQLFQRYQFSNKIVIIQDEPLTSLWRSYSARNAIKSSKWEGEKRFFERQLSWDLEKEIHKLIPKLSFSTNWLSSHLLYRNKANGSWLDCMSGLREKRYAATLKEVEELPAAGGMEFVKFVRQLNNTVILTTVPNSTKWTSKSVSKMARDLNVYYLPPLERGLYTYDMGHLHPESAAEFSNDFFNKFKRIAIRKGWIH